MTPLPLQFHRSTFIYRQVCRFGDVALYRKAPAFVKGEEKLEVVRIGVGVSAKCIPDLTVKVPEYCESYPLPGDYGKHLWTVSDEAEAFGLMAALLLA